jgi:hypothetical protein
VSLAVNGATVASAAAKNHVMTPQAQAGTSYNAISWTMTADQIAVPAGATLEWVFSGTVYAANNVFLACYAARGSSYIELPVASASTLAEPEPEPEGPAGNATTDADSDGLNDTWEQENFGGLQENGTGDPDADGLNNTGEQQHGTDPNAADTDGDGFSDGEEVTAGTDPLDATSFPEGLHEAPDGNSTGSPDGNATGGAQAPGLSLPLLAAAVAGVALLARRRRT